MSDYWRLEQWALPAGKIEWRVLVDDEMNPAERAWTPQQMDLSYKVPSSLSYVSSRGTS